MRTLIIILLFGLQLILVGTDVHAQSLAITTRDAIATAGKADDIYKIRIQLRREVAADSGKSIQRLEDLAESFKLLSEGFANYSHYKNGVEAYAFYIYFKNQQLELTRLNRLDSLRRQQLIVEKNELDETALLNKNIKELKEEEASLAGYRSKMITISTILIGIILILVIGTIRNLNRKINELRSGLQVKNDQLDRLFVKSVQIRINASIPSFLNHAASEKVAVIETLLFEDTGDTGFVAGAALKQQGETAIQQLKKITG